MFDPTLQAVDYDLARVEEEIVSNLPVAEHEMADLATNLLRYIANLLKLEDIDACLRVEIDRDLSALVVVVDALAERTVASLGLEIGGVSLSVKEERSKIAAVVAKNSLADDPFGASLRLDFLDGHLTRALICILENDVEVPADLVDLAHRKVRSIPEEEVPKIWALIKGEFREERGTRFPLDSPILPKGFLQATSLLEMRERIAKYLLRIKPRLIAESNRLGRQSTPASEPGLLLILTAQQAVARLRFVDEQLLRALSKLVWLWNHQEEELLDAMHLDRRSWVARRASLTRALGIDTVPAEPEIVERMRVRLLRRIVVYADTYAIRHSPLEEALSGYRLGMEVVVEDIREKERLKPEVRLQRDLARFLLERGHFAVGTKFGRNETDLLVAEGGDVVVIEAKRYTRPPTEKSIAANLAQLQVYVSQQQIPSSRGVLMIFNFSGRFIVAPRRWIGHRYLILPVNLGPLTASETTETITVEEARDGRFAVSFTNTPRPQ